MNNYNARTKEDIEDAKPFCFGSAMAINNQRAKSSMFQDKLNLMIKNTQNDKNINNKNFNELVKYTAEQTKIMVLTDGDDLQDKNSVGWFMGILCYTWRNSLPICKEKFDDIFLASWEYYFGVLLNDSSDDSIGDKNIKNIFIFDSNFHDRYENRQLTQEAKVERKIIIEEFVNGTIEVTISSVLSKKKAFLIESKPAFGDSRASMIWLYVNTEELEFKNGNEGECINYFYSGEDKDFEFIIQRVEDIVTKFVLKRLDNGLMIVYQKGD